MENEGAMIDWGELYFGWSPGVYGPNRPLGLHITSITPPAQGWPIAMYCPVCKETTFVLSLWAIKPTDGDYWRVTGMCERDARHNLEMSINYRL